MKKSVMTALAVYAAVAFQAQAQVTWPSAVHITTAPDLAGDVGNVTTVPTTKLGLLSFSLASKFQAYSVGGHWGIEVKPNDPRVNSGTVIWDNISYTYGDAVSCAGAATYRSSSRTINNLTIIAAINKALSWPVGTGVLGGPLVAVNSPYKGAFTTSAKIVAVNYDDLRGLPPYPPTEDYVGDEVTTGDLGIWNAPWYFEGAPDFSQVDGSLIPLNWPNQNYISWGKIYTTEGDPSWIGVRVFLIDPKNANANLKCFDVTPFFALEEAYCYYCWDTMDRVTDGKITYGTTSSSPPCATGTSACGVSGSGTTRFYWTVKFDNVQGGWTDDRNAPNYLLNDSIAGTADNASLYYNTICGFDPSWGDTFAWKLDDSDQPGSLYALGFTVSGQATYSWKIQKLSDGASWPVGKYSMAASGYGFSPMCGVFSGAVSMTEYDRSNKQFGGDWCVSP